MDYKPSKAHICKNGFFFFNSFMLEQDVSLDAILGTRFLNELYPFKILKKSKRNIRNKVLKKNINFIFTNLVLTYGINTLQRKSKNYKNILKNKLLLIYYFKRF